MLTARHVDLDQAGCPIDGWRVNGAVRLGYEERQVERLSKGRKWEATKSGEFNCHFAEDEQSSP